MFVRAARLVPATGVAFVVLVVVASLLTNDSPGKNASDSEILSYYRDGGNRDAELVAFFLIGLAGACFLLFLGSVRSALARAEGEPARLTAAAISAGVAFITLAVAAHVLGTSISWTSEAFDENFQVDPNTARLTLGLSFGFFAAALFAAGAMAVAVSMLAFESRAFPTWLAGFGVAAAIAGIATFFWAPFSLVVLAWILLLSIYLLRPERAPGATQSA